MSKKSFLTLHADILYDPKKLRHSQRIVHFVRATENRMSFKIYVKKLHTYRIARKNSNAWINTRNNSYYKVF